jgi:hypothetical protein
MNPMMLQMNGLEMNLKVINAGADLDSCNCRPVYTTSVLSTAPLKMGTRAQNFRHGTSAFWRVNVTKIGTGAAKLKRAETFSRGSLGTSSKRCRAQISKKIKNVFDIEHAQNKLSSFQHGSKRRKTATCQKF